VPQWLQYMPFGTDSGHSSFNIYNIEYCEAIRLEILKDGSAVEG